MSAAEPPAAAPASDSSTVEGGASQNGVGENGPEGPTRCGYVTLVGAPNAGKSTLLNALVGQKVSIVSSKVQTTRMRVLGIRIAGATQILFVDTPGIFAPKRRLERAMVAAAWQGVGDADLIVLLVDASAPRHAETQRIIDGLKQAGRRAILALNKIDLVKPAKLLQLTSRLDAEGIFTDVFMISGLTGDGVGDLLDAVAARLPEGPWLFPEDQVSDVPMRLLAAEITREKLFQQLHEELPYSIAVETEHWETFDNGDLRISQAIYVQRESQKAIVLGRGGRQIKAVGAAARAELEAMTERRVHLVLYVKVKESWIDDPERYRDLGLDHRS